ncbi:Uncharacterized conserved protein [Janthinobacterium sp. Marseille]|nr:alpha/beta hydrolase [Janthinobacterium sp. Marseille]ABR90981.1 Uncharacterized conserved protein [Janthinobacterium sp. Marseille]
MPTIHVNNVDIAYETQGNPGDQPILLIMGLGMQLISWPAAFCDGLVRQGFYVIRFDNRDSGLSSKFHHLGKPNTLLSLIKMSFRIPLTAGYTLDDMAADAVALLDALKIERAHIVGASMGGMIAQIIAGKYPEHTLSLTSIMSTSGRRGLPGPTRAARKVLFSRPPDPGDQQAVINHFVRTMEVIGSPAYPVAHEVLQERITQSVQRSLEPIATTRQLLAIGASGDRVDLLKTVQVPTLVIHGSDDPLLPVACGRETAELIPNAVLQEIDGMGHDLPDGLNDHLSQLIGEHCHAAAKLYGPTE